MKDKTTTALLAEYYRKFLGDQDSAAFIRRVSQRYLVGTLERLAFSPSRELRRAAVLALGFLADFESNDVMGHALRDDDRGVRIAAENGIRAIWRRQGAAEHRHALAAIQRHNADRNFAAAIREATDLVAEASWFAEAYNQRAIAGYSLGDFRAAIDDCRRTLARNPYHFGAAAGLGQCYLQLGERREALECFRHALEINPNLEGVRANVAHLERAMSGE